MITPAEYHADTSRISKSGLDMIARSPFEYYWRKINPGAVPDYVREVIAEKEEKNRALLIGNAFDCMLLTPKEFGPRYFVMDKPDLRTKAGKAAWADRPRNRGVLFTEEIRDIRAMVDAIRTHPRAGRIVEGAICQKIIEWEDPQTKALCKSRPDALASRFKIIADVKTITGMSRWEKHVHDFRYDVQNAFYFDGIRAALPGFDAFVFIVVDTNWPHEVAIRTLPDDVIELARRVYQRDLQTYVDCLKSGVWPYQSDRISDTEMPGWHFKKRESKLTF